MLRVEEQIDREALLGRTAVQPEDVAVAAHELDFALAGDPAERRSALGVDDQAGVDGHVLHQPGLR